MFEKIKVLGIVWLLVVFSYIILAFTNDVGNTMAETATTEMASQNLSSEIVGIEEALDSFSLWKWIIPGLLGIIITVVEFREEIISKARGE